MSASKKKQGNIRMTNAKSKTYMHVIDFSFTSWSISAARNRCNIASYKFFKYGLKSKPGSITKIVPVNKKVLHRLKISTQEIWNSALPFDSLLPGVPFLYSLKTSENLLFSDVLWGHKQGAPGSNGFILFDPSHFLLSLQIQS